MYLHTYTVCVCLYIYIYIIVCVYVHIISLSLYYCMCMCLYIYIALQLYFVLDSYALSTRSLDIHCPYLLDIRGTYDKFPDFFHMGTFIDSTHMKLYSPSKYLLRLQCTCCTIPTTSGRPHGSPRVSKSMTFVTASFISSIVS